jgi:hypothetical protein
MDQMVFNLGDGREQKNEHLFCGGVVVVGRADLEVVEVGDGVDLTPRWRPWSRAADCGA